MSFRTELIPFDSNSRFELNQFKASIDKHTPEFENISSKLKNTFGLLVLVKGYWWVPSMVVSLVSSWVS